MNTYTLEAVCTCPADKKPDIYKVTIRSMRTLWTNEIGVAIDSLSDMAISQEEYTWELHRLLKAHVRTDGVHPSFADEKACSHIRIICEIGAEK